MKNKTIHTINGVSYHHAGRGKWHFSGVNPKTGLEFTKIDVVHGRENAEKVASIIGGGLKRSKSGIDSMARENIHRVVSPDAKTFKGINFSQAFPLNPKR